MKWFTMPLLAALAIGCASGSGPVETARAAEDAAVDPGSLFDLGRDALRTGDLAAAARHMREAAEQGHTAAQYVLGVLHALGAGVPRDGVEALAWYAKAALEAGADAQYVLAEKLDRGVPGHASDTAVRTWTRRLARLGEETNPLRVGSDYPFGAEGLAADPAQAATWYLRAAEQAHVMAWYRLGRMHVSGRGVEVDYVRAHMFLSLCAERGLGDAEIWISKLAEIMTPEALQEAARLAERWRASMPEPAPVAPANRPVPDRGGGPHESLR